MAVQTDSQHALVTLEDLRSAAATLAGIAVRTPLLRDDLAERATSAAGSAQIWLKPEMLQRAGAFKFRGAYTFLARLSHAERERGVVAPSSGNHAQAVALAARLFGVPATVVMPTTVTTAKREGAERLGATIVLAGTNTAHRFEKAQEIVATTGATLVPPYDHPWTIAGQGTVALEVLDDLPDADVVLVPVGGGGLSSGVAAAIKLVRPQTTVIGVEPVGAPKLTRARQAGGPVTLDSTSSIADGLMAVRIGDLPYRHLNTYLDQVVTVPDAEIVKAMRHLFHCDKLVAEPSGAITLAALLSGCVEVRGRTVCILSGGNIDWRGMRQLFGDA